MSIPKAEIEQLKTHVDLLALCGSELTRVANTDGGEYAGPCPFCGGEDRFHLQPYTESGSRWFCRQCTGDPQVGYWRDIFDFVMRRDGIGFVDAYRLLVNGAPSTPATVTRDLFKKRDGETKVCRSTKWQRQAWKQVRQAVTQLQKADSAQASRDYLSSRGITSETCRAWQLGHAVVWNKLLKQRMQAIAFPWIDGDAVNAIQYRFTQTGLVKKARFGQKAGSDRHLFGLHLLQGNETLVLVEGELNAVSIWQSCQHVDVLSWGPQANMARPSVAQTAAKIASRYQRILLWADEFTASYRALSALHEHDLVVDEAVITASPDGCDANDLLLRGELGEFLGTMF